MADFIYKFGSTPCADKFDKLYREKIVDESLALFYNEGTITHITKDRDSISLLGYAYKVGEDVEQYLSDFLQTFSVERIVEAKKVLLGQYLMIVKKGGYYYLFSDFLQVRTIYYNLEEHSVCSSFAALGGLKTNGYKVFEMRAMRHCIYPAWLGNGTMDDRILRVRSYEYLKIAISTGEIMSGNIQFHLANQKNDSFPDLVSSTLSLLRDSIRHPQMCGKKIASTLTGGYDSRFVTALVGEYYDDIHLRIAGFKGFKSLDYIVAEKVAASLSLQLDLYETDFNGQIDDYYFLTDGLAPQENSVMTEMLRCAGNWELGFGGAFGTELYTTFDQKTTDELITLYMNRVKGVMKDGEEFYQRFEEALRAEFSAIREHYILKEPNDKDLMRIFRLNVTAFFSSPITSAYSIYGNQFEVFGTYPVIEAGLRIPYNRLGGQFGKFYLVPKTILQQINPEISRIQTTHFSPMCPLTFTSFIPYVVGKIQQRAYYKQKAKQPGMKFCWDEGLEKFY